MATGLLSEFPEAVRYPSMQPNSNNEIALVPYAKVGDTWSLEDKTVLAFAARALAEDQFKLVFPSGAVSMPRDFLLKMQDTGNIPVFLFVGGECAAAAWLSGCVARLAFAHFVVLEPGRGAAARKMGALVLDYWRSFVVSGRRVFDVIFGVIPSTNLRAIRFTQEIGMVRLGEVPKMLRGKAATILYAE